MKKLLLVFNGENYSEHLTDFAIKIAKQTEALLHALFTKDSARLMVQYPFPNDLSLAAGQLVSTEEMQRQNDKLVQANFALFRDACEEANVRYKIDGDNDITTDELVDHSAFADLILYDATQQAGVYSFRDLLTDTHCPVLLVPKRVTMPEKAILCYDESFSSIYAVKMYSYLFPEWKDLPTYVLSVNPKKDNRIRYNEYLTDWLPEHFSSWYRAELQGDLQRELISYIRKDDNKAIVVMGAFGRNTMSRLFHRSLANVVLEQTAASIFIIHE